MSDNSKQLEVLMKIIEQSPLRFICPKCLKGFPRGDKLNEHFRDSKDEIHQGLFINNHNSRQFHEFYQQALDLEIPFQDFQRKNRAQVFELAFILEHIRKKEPNSYRE
ncbi:conserved hypothetical protein [Talaromyces stipitatus ATCC 10500]|uniref:C2H2-type domain-containing protein n=1 Tax=Talaromyces stipitatus (strain ATCC 10500 / CBS 375.48 / QM 6759 / NRRL 1006) TaxID=441959 RepID=B8MFV0_TALSN|nr:uncharacterized protein TSTA_009390 [Talaromyces stipitatus ATCC 10500]EED15817.1 conserved hypothetical protein [Talaromyces stipitatus ATCC 10500]